MRGNDAAVLTVKINNCSLNAAVISMPNFDVCGHTNTDENLWARILLIHGEFNFVDFNYIYIADLFIKFCYKETINYICMCIGHTFW